MRAGVPIVPIAVIGAEESMPILFKVPVAGQGARASRTSRSPPTCWPSARSARSRYFPAKFKIQVLDPVRFDVEPDQPRYSRSRIMDESEAIRQQIQEALYEMLRQRRSVWFG